MKGLFCFQRLRISESSRGGSKGAFDENNSFGRRHRHGHRHLALHLGKLGLQLNQPPPLTIKKQDRVYAIFYCQILEDS